MQTRLRQIHGWVGFGFLALFLATGIYMATGIPDIGRMDHGQRMMMRSAHVYILMGALVNVVMACFMTVGKGLSTRREQIAGSILIWLAPLCFLVAFFVEPEPGRLDRPVSIVGAGALGIGVILHAFAVRRNSGNASQPASSRD